MSSSENIPHIDEQDVATESKENLGLNMVAGAIAGLVTDLFFFPLDTLKTRIQATVSGKDYSSQTKGKGLFSGLSAGIVISAPACACYWGGYELSKSLLLKNYSDVRAECRDLTLDHISTLHLLHKWRSCRILQQHDKEPV